MINTNLGSLFNMCRNVIEGMRARKFGRIVNISSINGQKGQMGQTNYSAAKAGEIGFTKALAQESARSGITVNAIAPGYINTEMVQAVPKDVLEKNILPLIPIGRLGEPEEIARCVVFLASDDAGLITGSTLTANGGQYLTERLRLALPALRARRGDCVPRFSGRACAAFRLVEPHTPIFPCPRHRSGLQIVGAGELGLLGIERRDVAEAMGLDLQGGIARHIDGSECELLERAPGNGRAVPAHQHDPIFAERARERGAFLRLRHDQAGVAEVVARVPERRSRAHAGAEVVDRLELHAGNAERQDRRRVMVADRVHLRPRLVDLAVDDALAVEPLLDRLDDLRVERELVNVLRLHQLRPARARQQIAARIGRMAHADVAEGVEHAFVGDHAVGARQQFARFGKGHRHG